MSSDLVTVEFVEMIYGATVDAERAAVLVAVASNVVREYCGAAWDSTDVPANISLAVAQMVGDAFTSTPADAAQVKAEQIGDYRVEYTRANQLAISTKPYEDVLDKYRTRGYSITTSVPFDGPVTDVVEI